MRKHISNEQINSSQMRSLILAHVVPQECGKHINHSSALVVYTLLTKNVKYTSDALLIYFAHSSVTQITTGIIPCLIFA